MKRYATAVWKGTLKDGKGTISTESQAIDNVPYGFSNRFENEPGTNPEELIAAAHASCFAMAFSSNLGKKNMEPQAVEVKGAISFEQKDDGWSLTGSHLDVNVKLPEGDRDAITSAAEAAKDGCPVARALAVPISMQLNIET